MPRVVVGRQIAAAWRPGRSASRPASSWGCCAAATPRLVEDRVLVLASRPGLRPTLARRTPRSRSSPAGSTSRTDDDGTGRTGSAGRGTAGPCPRPAPSASFTSRYQTTGGFCLDVARGGEDLADELVVRLVLVQAVANPGVEREGAAVVVGVLPPLVAQERAPLVGEVVGVVGAVEQRDRSASSRLSASVSARNASASSGVGSRPAMSMRHAAEERRVVAHGRRRQAERLELLEDQLVDEVLRRRQVRRPARPAGSSRGTRRRAPGSGP